MDKEKIEQLCDLQIAGWKKDQLRERRKKMEEMQPGYLNLRSQFMAMMAMALFVRGAFHTFCILIGQEPLYYIFLAPFSILFCYAYYNFFMCWNIKAARIFFLLRALELAFNLFQIIPNPLYLPFLGRVWWALLMLCLLSDLTLLGRLGFTKSGAELVACNRRIYSAETFESEER